MDHFLLPHGATIPLTESVPYVADQYDNGTFLDYPERSCFKDIYALFMTDGAEAHYDKARLQETARPELEAFLQTWLFFGLLHEVFNHRAPASAFITWNEELSRTIITTAPLPAIAVMWIAEHTDRPQTERHELLEHLVICIQTTNDFMRQICRQIDVGLNRVMLSIAAIGETIESVVLETLHKGTRSLPTAWASFYESDELTHAMRDIGWCPSEVAMWREPWGSELQMLYYLSKMRQPQGKDHSACNSGKCVASQYDMSEASLVHRCTGRDCGDVAVDDNKVMDILADGHVALLDIVCNSTGEIEIEVISSKDQQKYVSLSHVWADGLGNPYANALPRCQLAYVADILERLRTQLPVEESKLLLWLDTLCCPVRSAGHRAMCLERMTSIYRNAAYVLVLDAPLSHYRVHDLDSVEACMRLKFSGWMRRLWTLQEGVHARRLWVQLQDGAVDLDALEEELDRIYKTDIVHEAILMPLVFFMRELRGLINRRDGKWQASSLIDTIRAFKGRSVSVATDEPLCLSNCLGVDQREVVRVDPADRMKAFWKAMGEAGSKVPNVPTSIIFQREKRLTDPGFRWAPASFMHKHEFGNVRRPKTMHDVATITPQGLLARYPACEISVPNTLSLDDQTIWDDILEDAAHALFVRHHDCEWMTLLWNSTPGAVPESGSLAQHMKEHGGTHVLIAEPALDRMLGEADIREAAQCMTGSITAQESDHFHFHSMKYATIGSLSKNLVIQLEAVWQISRNEALRSALLPSRKKVGEGPWYPDLPTGEGLDRMPNDGVELLFNLIDVAIEDENLVRSYGTTPTDRMRVNLAGLTVFMIAERYGEITRTWSSSQMWCVD